MTWLRNVRLSKSKQRRQARERPAYTGFVAMNVEKTMEFILQQQARAEVQMAAMREQQARSEKKQAKTDQQLAKTEKQIAAIQKLIVAGMKMIVTQGRASNNWLMLKRSLRSSSKG